MAGTAEQAGGAAHDLDPVIDRHVVRLAAHGGLEYRGNAIHLERFDLHATREDTDFIVRSIALFLVEHARRLGQHVLQAHQVLITHTLAGHHTDRLGCFADRQRQLGCGPGNPCGVGASALRGITQAAGIDVGGAQLQRSTACGFFRQQIVVSGSERLQPGTLKQHCEPLVHAVVALQAGGVTTIGQCGFERKYDPCIACKLVQCRAERARRNPVSLKRLFCTGLAGLVRERLDKTDLDYDCCTQ